jgi:hypothetical protein
MSGMAVRFLSVSVPRRRDYSHCAARWVELQERSRIETVGLPMKEAIRVYALTNELGVDPKQILSLCEKVRIETRSILSMLNAKQRQLIETLLRDDNPGDETHPAMVPVWRPPPALLEAVRLKPDPDEPTKSTQS